MFQKGSKLYSIINYKCPRCQQGDFFKHKFTYHLKKVIQQKRTCSHCNLQYKLKPSFFLEAMYLSYGVFIALIVLTFAISSLFFQFNVSLSILTSIIVLLVLLPIFLRLSRIIWINLFIHYNSKLKSSND